MSKQKTKKPHTRSHPKHFLKVYWPYIPILLVVGWSMVFSGVNPTKQTSFTPSTLAYATEMSIGGLLSSTNVQRQNNGFPALTLNSALSSSAQAKANDMASRDYWSHNTPDGKEPWVFIDAAGYSYKKAGENLAYGFSSSDATVIGWMNSPSHRANILDQTYREVGFGFVNAENFIGVGQQTIVVAHYGEPLSAPAPASSPPATSTAPSTKQATSSKPKQAPTPQETPAAPVPEPETVEAQPQEQEKKPLTDDRINQPITTDNPIPQDRKSTNITLLQDLTGGAAPWSAVALTAVTFSVVIIWLIKHAVLVKRFALEGEHFVAHHPIIDVVVVSVAAAAVYLSQSSGVVL